MGDSKIVYALAAGILFLIMAVGALEYQNLALSHKVSSRMKEDNVAWEQIISFEADTKVRWLGVHECLKNDAYIGYSVEDDRQLFAQCLDDYEQATKG